MCMQQQQATGKELKRHVPSSHSITLWEITSTCRPMAASLAPRAQQQQQQAGKELEHHCPRAYTSGPVSMLRSGFATDAAVGGHR